jgi:hypothetical protein
MQDRNKSSTPRPKPGDGTQPEEKKNGDANWFGSSQEPQEEYVENSPPPGGSSERAPGPTSEGEATFEGVYDKRRKGFAGGTSPKPPEDSVE